MKHIHIRAACLLMAAASLGVSCSPLPKAPLELGSKGGAFPLYTDSRLPEGPGVAVGGAGKASVLFTLDKPIELDGAYPAIEVRYTLTGSAHLELFEKKPRGKPFLAVDLAGGPGEIRWTIPLPRGSNLAALRFTALPREGAALSSLVILGLDTNEAEYGFTMDEKGARFSQGASFVRESDGSESIRIEHPYTPESAMVAELRGRRGVVQLTSNGGKTAVFSFSRPGTVLIPLAALGGLGVLTAQAREKGSLESLVLKPSDALESPLLLDLGTILALPPTADSQAPYSLFRWDVFPQTLVFDFRDYAVQDAYLKRIAFFVEKEGYRGRLASDAELASLHGWNAHDYRTEDLAAFFGKAERTNFPLSAEEKELLGILVKNGVLVRDGGSIKPGKGAFISISRESDRYFRRLFLNHEASHALFFQDENYRRLAEEHWRALNEVEKRFWNLFLANRDYDPTDAYLSYNEFQAYLTQQASSQLEEWLKTVAYARLSKSYPDRAEAIRTDLEEAIPGLVGHSEALDAYLKKNYGLRAGSLDRVRFK
jgi:hypothetical protein